MPINDLTLLERDLFKGCEGRGSGNFNGPPSTEGKMGYHERQRELSNVRRTYRMGMDDDLLFEKMHNPVSTQHINKKYFCSLNTTPQTPPQYGAVAIEARSICLMQGHSTDDRPCANGMLSLIKLATIEQANESIANK
ncbi:hypothetical protein CDAR_622061 [Caerostris darwini]|uniref:Uncharacterized protein n=1 Tax=Caerostris darwini TaxID=1538125 RepID=A0AAV4SC08_9ARAC|nr:hypothetical protein CDAR_622061 [Caerostris darwini]